MIKRLLKQWSRILPPPPLESSVTVKIRAWFIKLTYDQFVGFTSAESHLQITIYKMVLGTFSKHDKRDFPAGFGWILQFWTCVQAGGVKASWPLLVELSIECVKNEHISKLPAQHIIECCESKSWGCNPNHVASLHKQKPEINGIIGAGRCNSGALKKRWVLCVNRFMKKGELWYFSTWTLFPVVLGSKIWPCTRNAEGSLFCDERKELFHVGSFKVQLKNTHVFHCGCPLHVFALTCNNNL